MPSTIVKLSSSDARAWAHNQPVWLHESGDVARPVTRQEQYAISRSLEKSRDVQQSFRIRVPLYDVVQSRNGIQARRTAQRGSLGVKMPEPAVPMAEFAFEIIKAGKLRVVNVWQGNLRYVTGRQKLAARLLADHGECVLHGRNGMCIAVLRDPLVAERAPNLGKRVQYSRNPDDEKLLAEERERRDNPGRVVATRLAPPKPRNAVLSPEECKNDCRGYRGGEAWALAKGARPPTEREHHPVCMYAAAWSATLPDSAATTSVLYDLELSRVARAAEENEIEEANVTESKTGMRQVTVQGRLYAVLAATEANQAAREARGDTEDESDDADTEVSSSDTPEDPVLSSISSALAGADPEGQRQLVETRDDEGSVTHYVDGREVVTEQAVIAPLSATEERERWPELDDLQQSKVERRSGVTAATYLARRTPMAGSGS